MLKIPVFRVMIVSRGAASFLRAQLKVLGSPSAYTLAETDLPRLVSISDGGPVLSNS
jgi:hypothetical protein